MPTKIEKDIVTGTDTTGHEWDGLKELNTPLPKWWVWTFYATCIWALGYSILYPSVPGINSYFPGLLGFSQRARVEADVAALAKQRAAVMERLNTTPLADVRKDPQLYAVAMTAGRIAYANNCQPCHAAGGAGLPGYPVLADDTWLWGGKLDDIRQTVTYGIRSGHPEARLSAMLRFGADEVLTPAEIDQVTDYVMTLYGKAPEGKDVAAGRKIFVENCVSCHGENGQGVRDVGGPPLKSAVHLYGDTREAVRAQIVAPRMGVMPAWNTRLDEATIRAVTLYVHSLGGGE